MSIKIKWLSDDADAIRGSKAVKDSLQDVSREADNAGDDITGSFKDAAREAGWSADKIEDSLEDIARQADRTGRKVGSELDDGFDKAKRGADDFKQEANQTARETAASFDGSAESIGEAFQEVAANAFGAFGPAAGLAGLAVAAGIGGMTANFEELRQKSDEVKQGIIADFLEVGDALDKEAVDARVRDLLGNENTRKQAELLKEILGVDLADAVLVLAGDFETAGITMEDAMKAISEASGNVDFQTWLELKNTMEATNAAFEVGTELAQAREEASTRVAEAERTQIQRTRDADQERWEAFATAAQTAKTNAAGEVVIPVRLGEPDVGAFRRRIADRFGTLSLPVQLGPGIGRWLEG